MDSLQITPGTRVLVLTGAGVSAESGIPTFRDANGLWENHPVEEVASPQGWRKNPQLVWTFYSQRRAAAVKCEPNAGHRALVALEERLGDDFLLATQNVDNLHPRAGSQRCVEMHGNLFKTRCDACDREPFVDPSLYETAVPTCDRCNEGQLRPHIVWFGEMLDPRDLQRIERFLSRSVGKRLVFLAAGTSGAVYPAANLVNVCRGLGAETHLVNAQPADNTHAFEHFHRGTSATLLPALLA